MPRATDKDLLLVSKSDKVKLATLAAGASLVTRTGYTLSQLQAKAIKDRLSLARILLREAQAAASANQPAYRTAVSRAYYAMYHAVRAVSFHFHGGDDFEEHSKLPSHIPSDFPSKTRWENELKRARLDRNRADYDPYPRGPRSFEPSARDLVRSARTLLTEVRVYLRNKGYAV